MEDFGPIIETTPIAYSFNTPGWMILLGFFTAFLLFLFCRWIYRYRKNAYRRLAVSRLAGCSEIRDINVILKTIAMKSFGRRDVASLTGEQWISFLLDKLKKQVFDSSELVGILNQDWTSIDPSNDDLDTYKSFSKYWIRNYDV